MIQSSKDMALEIVKAIDNKKGQDIRVLEIKKLSSFADYFIIAHASNTRQVKAMANEVEEKMGKQEINLDHKEGHHEGRWILLDYIQVVVHLFMEEERKFYDIERVWKDAPVVNVDNCVKSIYNSTKI